MKKLLAFVLSAMLTISALGAAAFASDSNLPSYEKIDMSAMLSSMVRPSEATNKGKLTDKFWDADQTEKSLNYASFQIVYGKVETGTFNEFTNFAGTGLNDAGDSIWDAGAAVGSSGVGLWRWQMRAKKDNAVIFKLVIKADCDLTVGHNEIKGAWDLTKKLTLYKEAMDGANKTYTKIAEKSQNQENCTADTYIINHKGAKAGEVFYFEVSSENVTGGTTSLVPYFVFGDQWKTLKETKNTALDSNVAAKTQADYSTENWKKITDKLAEAKAAISAAFQEKVINDIYDTAVIAIDDIWTIADEEAGMAAYKTAKKTEIETYASGKGQANYSSAKWTDLQKIATDKKAAIDGLDAKGEIDKTVEDAKIAIDAVLTLAQETELATYKVAKKAELDAYLTGKNYTEIKLGLMTESVSEFKSQIDAAEIKAEVDTLLTAAKKYVDSFAADYFEYDMSDMVSATIVNNFEEVDTPYSTYQLLYGKVDGQMKKFAHKTGSGDTGADNKLFDSASENVGFWRWQLRASNGMDAIMKITVKADAFVDITHAAPVVADPWAKQTGIKLVVEDEDGYQIKIKDTQIEANAPANKYVMGVHAKKGDVIYVVYYTSNASQGTTDFIPNFKVDITKYDESKRTDFSSVKALDVLKEAKYQLIDEKVAGFKESDYSAGNWGQISDIASDAKAAIKEAASTEEITQLADKALADLDDVQTIAEVDAELSEYKETKKAELTKYALDLGEKNYSKDNWKKIQEELNAGKTAIDAAINKAGVNTAYSAGKGAIDRVEKKEGGCASSASGAASAVAITAVLALIVVIKRK